MATTRAATTHDQHRSPIATQQTPQGLLEGQRPPEQGSESSPSLHRYLGNSYVQAMSTKTQRLGLQTKLAVNEPGDIYEREADRVADQVVAAPTHSNISSAPFHVQRFSGQSHGQVDAVPASVDQTLATPGRTLEPVLRQDMEQRFGYDFSNVRVHTGAAAEQSAQDVNAHAYTVGHDIVFGAGRFAPGTTEGRRLIAHELTHVVHQSGRGVPSIQRKEKEDQHNTTTVTQITVEAKTTGEERGRALTSDGQTLLIAIEVNKLSPSRITTGKLLLGSKVEDWKQIHLGSMGANLFVFDLPPGVTVGQTLTIIVEPTARERAEVEIRGLKQHIRDFVTGDKRRKVSEHDLLKAASAGRILERYGVTEDELLLLQQRRIDLQELGVQQTKYADLEDWALSQVGFREQARAAEQANASTLLKTTERLSLASLNLYQQDPLLEIIEPQSRISALATANAIKFRETRPMHGASEKVETPFGDFGDLRQTLQAFENALVADLRTLATTFLDDTEVRLIRMQHQFVGRGDKQWGPGYLEREIEKIKNDPDVLEVLKKHEAYVKALDQEELDDLKYIRGPASAEDADVEELLYRERQKERQKERKNEKDRHDKLLRETVAKKSKLKLPPGFDVDDILSANSGHRAQVMLNAFIVDGRAKVREAREKLSNPKFLYAADIVIDKEKERIGEALAAGSACNRYPEGTLEHAFCKGFAAKRRNTINWIIDQLAHERRAQTTLWQDIWKVFEFASNFIPGPIGWASRLVVAAVAFDQKIESTATQSVLHSTRMSEIAPDPNAASSALGAFGLQVVTDLPFSPAIKGTKQLTLGLGEDLAGGAAKLGEHGVANAGERELAHLGDEAAELAEHGVANAPEKQVIKPPVAKDVPLKPTRELDPAELSKKPPANDKAPILTDIEKAAQKRAATTRQPQPPPQQQVTETSRAASPAANDNARVLTDIEKAAQKRAAATRRPQAPPQQQVQEATLAPTGTGDVVPAKIIESGGTPPDTSRVSMVGSGGGNPPGRRPTSGSVRPPATPASPPARAPQSQPRGAHPHVIRRDQPRRGFEDEEPTLVDLEPPGQELRGSARPSGGGPSPSQVGTTTSGELPRPPRPQRPSAAPSPEDVDDLPTPEFPPPPAGAPQGQAQRVPSPATPGAELPARQAPAPPAQQPAVPGRGAGPQRFQGGGAVQAGGRVVLDSAGMRNYLLDAWHRNRSMLDRIIQAQGARGPARHQQLLDILRDFERLEGIPVHRVPRGTVQRVRGRGDLGSLRSSPGVLQIEEQVFQNTDTLMSEVRHALAHHYAGGLRGVPTLPGENGIDALIILESAIESGEGEAMIRRLQ